MTENIFKDLYVSLAIRCAILSLPFITLGMIVSELTAVVSAIVGGIGLIMAVVRFVTLSFRKQKQVLKADVIVKFGDIVLLPYSIALSSAITQIAGINPTSGYLLACVFLIINIISILKFKQTNKIS